MLTTQKPKLLVLETKNEITKYYNKSGGMALPSFTRGMALPSPLRRHHFGKSYMLPRDLFDFDDTFDEEQISAYLKRLAREWECMKRHNSTCLKNDELRRGFAINFQYSAEYMLKRSKSLIDEKNLARAEQTSGCLKKNQSRFVKIGDLRSGVWTKSSRSVRPAPRTH